MEETKNKCTVFNIYSSLQHSDYNRPDELEELLKKEDDLFFPNEDFPMMASK